MSALQSSRGHVVVYLQIPACPLILAPKDRMASSLSCRMLCNVARATMMFSWRTASVLIAARTSASPLPVRVPPAARVRSRLRSSSQHSNNCATTSAPVNLCPLSVFVPAGDKVRPFFPCPRQQYGWPLQLVCPRAC